MKIKVVWGFLGDPSQLQGEGGRVRAGDIIDNVGNEYAHALIGKGLAVAIEDDPGETEAKASATGKREQTKRSSGAKAEGKDNGVE